jgi:predicted DNA-binding transcriptional regulator AlpA
MLHQGQTIPVRGGFFRCFEGQIMSTAIAEPPAPDAASVPERLLTIEDIKRVFGVSTATVYNWTASGRLPAPVRMSRRVMRWHPADIAALIGR